MLVLYRLIGFKFKSKHSTWKLNINYTKNSDDQCYFKTEIYITDQKVLIKNRIPCTV